MPEVPRPELGEKEMQTLLLVLALFAVVGSRRQSALVCVHKIETEDAGCW